MPCQMLIKKDVEVILFPTYKDTKTIEKNQMDEKLKTLSKVGVPCSIQLLKSEVLRGPNSEGAGISNTMY